MSTRRSESGDRVEGMKARLQALSLPVTDETVDWAQRVSLSEAKVPAVLEPAGMTRDEASTVARMERQLDSPLARKRRLVAKAFDTAA